ncbi:MAG: hypothetical protein V3W44_10715 [Dehalococcoidales bacterium]
MADEQKKIALTITANTRQLRRDMRRATGEVKGFEHSITRLGAKMRAMRMRFQQTGIFGRGGGMLRGAAGFAGVFGFAQMIQGAREGNAALTDIAITGNLTNKEMMALKKTMYEVSNSTAKSTQELGSFVSVVTTMTGDAKGAHAALADMGEVMVATGASGEALAGIYVKLTTTMGLMPKEAGKALNVLRSQEKLGSITMANIAANFGKVLGPAGVFGAEAKGIKGVRTLGGLFQIAQRGFAVGQEGQAATSAGAFLGFLGRRAKKVKKVFGVDVFDPATGEARDLPTVLEELGTAFGQKREAFRTKGALIFGRAGIRTAQQLQVAMAGGAGAKVGSFASFNEIVRQAGGENVIGADAARRRKSAAFQFDETLNILKNTLKKPMSELFKSLAKGLKEWGPDLVRTLKFLIENSSRLLKLWLGVKGITFFRNFMAPLGGMPGQAGMAMAGAGGGAMMMPGGQMVPVAARGGAVAARGTGTFLNPLVGGGQFGVGGFGAGRRSDLQMLRAERSRLGRAGRWMGDAAYRYGGGAARLAGQGLGVAGMMGLTEQVGPGWADMASNMALMSGNPYAMAAAGLYKVGGGAIQSAYTGTGQDKEFSFRKFHEKIQMGMTREEMMHGKGMSARTIMGRALSQAAGVGGLGIRRHEGAQSALAMIRGGTIETIEHQKAVAPLLAQLGFGGARGGEFIFNRGVIGARGIAGVKTLRGKLGGALGTERGMATAALRSQGKAVTEESLRSISPEYARLADLMGGVEKLLADMASGKIINVNATVVTGDTPASRLAKNVGTALGTDIGASPRG